MLLSMNDEELRSRFRRSFASEPERSGVRPPPKTSQPNPVAPDPTPIINKAPQANTPAATNTHNLATVEKRPVSRKPKSNRSIKKPLFIITVLLVALGLSAGGFTFYESKQSKSDKTNVLGQATQSVTIPLYYPKNLPNGYTDNNDSLAIKQNVFYSSVTGPNNTKFYITQQPIPDNFNFVDFSKKFLNPDTFSSDAGQVVAGQVGSNTIGSIKTNKNTWILINSIGTNSLDGLEVAARSLEPTN